MQVGVVLINIGSPAAPRRDEAKSFLRQFLMDPHIISLPWPARWLLVNAFIVPRRAGPSANEYRKIWTARGSPLVAHTADLAAGVQRELGAGYVVKHAMRYGSPSIGAVLGDFRDLGLKSLVVCPLFPQYCACTTQSAVDEVQKHAAGFDLRMVLPFYGRPDYIKVLAGVSRDAVSGAGHVVMSFHGVPAGIGKDYGSQCHETAELVAEALGLPEDRFTVSFQSRMGAGEWLGPSTRDVVSTLGAKGVQNIAVMCPSFVSDCLETLGEIGISLAEEYREKWGGALTLVPSLNSDARWSKVLANFLLP